MTLTLKEIQKLKAGNIVRNEEGYRLVVSIRVELVRLPVPQINTLCCQKARSGISYISLLFSQRTSCCITHFVEFRKSCSPTRAGRVDDR